MNTLHADAPAVNAGAPPVCADACHRCGGTNTFTVRCTEGPHWGWLQCGDCRRFVRWVGAPIDPAAGQFPMPFGRYRGRPLGELDDGYLRRLRDECSAPRIAVRARQVLLSRRAGR